MTKLSVLDFGVCLSTTISVEDLLNRTGYARIDPDLSTGSINGNQRKESKNWQNKIANGIRERVVKLGSSKLEPECVFTQPIVLHCPENIAFIKNEVKLLEATLSNTPDILDGGSRKGALRKIYEELHSSNGVIDNAAAADLLKMRVKVEIYYNLTLWQQQQLFLRINFNVKPVSKDVSYLFLAEIYSKSVDRLTQEEKEVGRVSAMALRLAMTSTVFRGRVKTVNRDCDVGPTFISLVNVLDKNLHFLECVNHTEEDDICMMYFIGWEALYKHWDILNQYNLWSNASHLNVLEFGFHLITNAINIINPDYDEEQFIQPNHDLSQADARKFFRLYLNDLLEEMYKRAGGNPFIRSQFGGNADEFASGAGKGKLVSFLQDAIEEHDLYEMPGW